MPNAGSFLRFAAFALTILTVAACAGRGAGGQGRTLVFTGLAGEPDTLNPLVTSAADVDNLSHLYMSLLVESDARGNLVPEIAAAVPTMENGGISADGRTIVYHLRRNVRWQDGRPLTARDVLFSYRAVMNPRNDVLTRVGYAEVDSIHAPDPYTVEIHLRERFSPIVSYFFGPQNYPKLLPAHLLDRYADLNRVPYNERPIGAGPFRVVQWKHGDSVTFEANPYYWRGKPQIDRLVFRIIPDPNTRAEQLQTEEAGAYFDVDPQLLPQIRAIPGVRVVMTPVNDLHVLFYNVQDPVMSDVRVRRAIAMAIDRKKLVQAATHGAGIAVEADQPANGWARDASLPPIPYDPSAAARLLDSAGWRTGAEGVRVKDGLRMEAVIAIAPQGINGSALVATVIQQDLRNVGIAATIKSYPPALLWESKNAGGIMANGRYQLAYYAWWTLGPDPDDTWNFGCDQIPPAGENFAFWCNARADRAMHDALLTFDRSRREADYAIVQRQIVRDLPELTLWQVVMPDALRVPLQNFAPSPAGSTFWNAWSWSLR